MKTILSGSTLLETWADLEEKERWLKETKARTEGYIALIRSRDSDLPKTPERLAILENIKAKYTAFLADIEKEKQRRDAWLKTLDETGRQIYELRYKKKTEWQAMEIKLYYSKSSLYRIHANMLKTADAISAANE